MKNSKATRFFIGLLIGGLAGMLYWYWQKSTTAEDGALSLLDKLAKSEARVRELQNNLSANLPSSHPKTMPAPQSQARIKADFEQIKGVGPILAQRLQDAGIHTFADLAQHDPAALREIAGLKDWQKADPADWIEQAKKLEGSE